MQAPTTGQALCRTTPGTTYSHSVRSSRRPVGRFNVLVCFFLFFLHVRHCRAWCFPDLTSAQSVGGLKPSKLPISHFIATSIFPYVIPLLHPKRSQQSHPLPVLVLSCGPAIKLNWNCSFPPSGHHEVQFKLLFIFLSLFLTCVYMNLTNFTDRLLSGPALMSGPLTTFGCLLSQPHSQCHPPVSHIECLSLYSGLFQTIHRVSVFAVVRMRVRNRPGAMTPLAIGQDYFCRLHVSIYLSFDLYSSRRCLR